MKSKKYLFLITLFFINFLNINASDKVVEDVKIFDINSNSVKLSFSKIENSSYKIYITNLSNNKKRTKSSSDNELIINNLEPNTKYSIKVRNYEKINNKNDYGKYSKSVEFKTSENFSPVKNFEVVSIPENINIKFENPAYFDQIGKEKCSLQCGFNIYIKDTKTNKIKKKFVLYNADNNYDIFINSEINTKYEVYLEAVYFEYEIKNNRKYKTILGTSKVSETLSVTAKDAIDKLEFIYDRENDKILNYKIFKIKNAFKYEINIYNWYGKKVYSLNFNSDKFKNSCFSESIKLNKGLYLAKLMAYNESGNLIDKNYSFFK